MAGPLNPDAGEVIYPRVSGALPPVEAPITAEDLGPIPNGYKGRIAYIEDEADKALEMIDEEYAEGGKKWNPFSIPLSKLSRGAKESAINDIDELTGLHGIIQGGHGPVMFKDYIEYDVNGVPHLSRSPAGRIPTESGHNDPRLYRLEQQSIRFQNGRGILPIDKYASSGAHKRERVINNIQLQINKKMNTDVMEDGKRTRAGRILVFDVESPGLKPQEGIWQLSARMLEGDKEPVNLTRTFENARMNWGGTVGTQTLQDFIRPPEGFQKFESGIRDFLEMAEHADFVAGHNLPFDYEMLHHGITNTPAYSNDTEFRRLSDIFFHKFYDPKTKQIGNVLDTSELARHLMGDIPLADELRGGPSPHQFSMQNILLQTNILQRVKEDEGEEKVAALLTRGTHYADVDVPFEAHLVRYLQEGMQGGPGLSYNPVMSAEERAMIAGSRALTPNIPLSDPAMLHPKTRAIAEAAGIMEPGDTHLSPLENMVIASRNLNMETSSPPSRISSRVKRAWSRLQIGDEMTPDMEDLANNAGIWQRKFGGRATQGGTLRRDMKPFTNEEWTNIQSDLQKAHVPLAGLSMPERHLTALLGQAGHSENADENIVRNVFGQDIAPIGKFFGSESVEVVGGSQITKLPMRFLEEWEQNRIAAGEDVTTAFSNPGEGLQTLQGSFFPVGDHFDMSLVAQINEDEKENLLGFLKGHPEIRDNPALIGQLEESFAANTGTYGVQVGLLSKLKGGKDVNMVKNAFDEIMGTSVDRTDQSATINLPYAGREGNSVYTMGALIGPDVLTEEEKSNIVGDVAIGMERHKKAIDQAKTPMMTVLARQAEEGRLADLGPARMANRVYSAVKRNSPILAIAGSLAGLSYYRHKKHKEDMELSETMALQPTSPNPRSNQYGLVQQLDANKIGHTMMGASKYSYLFGAGYQ